MNDMDDYDYYVMEGERAMEEQRGEYEAEQRRLDDLAEEEGIYTFVRDQVAADEIDLETIIDPVDIPEPEPNYYE